MEDDAEIVAYFSACLAKSVFGFLKASRPLQSNLYSYLKIHNLDVPPMISPVFGWNPG